MRGEQGCNDLTAQKHHVLLFTVYGNTRERRFLWFAPHSLILGPDEMTATGRGCVERWPFVSIVVARYANLCGQKKIRLHFLFC